MIEETEFYNYDAPWWEREFGLSEAPVCYECGSENIIAYAKFNVFCDSDFYCENCMYRIAGVETTLELINFIKKSDVFHFIPEDY